MRSWASPPVSIKPLSVGLVSQVWVIFLGDIDPTDDLVVAEEISSPPGATGHVDAQPVVIRIAVGVHSHIITVQIYPMPLKQVLFSLSQCMSAVDTARKIEDVELEPEISASVFLINRRLDIGFAEALPPYPQARNFRILQADFVFPILGLKNESVFLGIKAALNIQYRFVFDQGLQRLHAVGFDRPGLAVTENGDLETLRILTARDPRHGIRQIRDILAQLLDDVVVPSTLQVLDLDHSAVLRSRQFCGRGV